MRRFAIVVFVALALTVSCSSSSGSPPLTDASAMLTSEGFTCRELIVNRTDRIAGERHCVWFADTQEKREQGLMGITDPNLGGPEAMVFEFPAASSTPFWMKDTLLPLSVAWVGPDGVVLGVTDMAPCGADTSNCPLYPPPGSYLWAIEMAQGRPQNWGIETGARVEIGVPC